MKLEAYDHPSALITNNAASTCETFCLHDPDVLT